MVVWAFFGTDFLWDWNENWTFPVLCPLLFPNLLAYWMHTFTASSFRIWNSFTGIPSPPLGLFVVMLPKAHLTSHSRMSGSEWVKTPSWLSGSWRSFLYSSSVYSCHLLTYSASVRFIPFESSPSFMKCSLDIFNFLEEISSLSHSVVFLYFFALIAEEGFLIFPCYSLEICIQMLISFFSPLLFASLLFTAICRASSDSHFAFLFLGDGLDPCLLFSVTSLLP